MVNRLKSLSPQFRKILKITSDLASSLGVKIYLVGGVVRDLLLGRDIFDLDIVVEGDAIALASNLAKNIKGEFRRHHSFGTAVVLFKGHKIDFATARTESYSHWGALPKVKPATLEKDLFRRDFTVNAMAVNLNAKAYGSLIDLYRGLSDFKDKLIRIIHDASFLEDPTRILRAIKFEQRFSFKIEPETFKLMRAAISCQALKLVTPHRLREGLILILNEPEPYRYIKRIKELEGFSFLDNNIRLDENSMKLLRGMQKTIMHYQSELKGLKTLQVWLIYLAGILIKLSAPKLNNLLNEFGLRKIERETILSIKNGISKIKKIDKPLKPHLVYESLMPYSMEALLFFYAYYQKKFLRMNIDYFLKDLVNVKLKVRGKDLKALGFEPYTLYSKLLRRLLYSKIDKGLENKREEIREARAIFKILRSAEK